jgi:hypothetical protein
LGEVNCSIAVSGSKTHFTVDGVVVQTARLNASQFSGYQRIRILVGIYAPAPDQYLHKIKQLQSRGLS